MKQPKLLVHPDREYVIQQLLNGTSPNVLHKWLSDKYPDPNDTNRMNVATISEFRKNYLNLNRDAVRLLKKQQTIRDLGLPHNENAGAFMEIPGETEEQHHIRVKETLLQSKTYSERLKEITEATLDGPRKLKQLVSLLDSRLEVYYNEIASATTVGEALKSDKMFAEYINLMKDLIKDAKKIEDDYNKQPDEGSVDLNVVHEQVGIIRDTVKDMFAKLDPDLALEFMDNLNKKMANLKYEPQQPPDMLARVEKLNKRIKEIKESNT